MPTLETIVSEAKFRAREAEIRSVNPKAADVFLDLDRAQTSQDIQDALGSLDSLSNYTF